MTTTPTANPIATLLEEKAIRHFAVIDDAFGPPVRLDFGNALDTFWAAVEGDGPALAELNAIAGTPLADAGGLSDPVLAKIWEARERLGPLAPHYGKYLAPVINGKAAPLRVLVGHLGDTLGRSVTPHSSLATFQDTRAQVIFVDYYMGPSGQAASVETAKGIVAGITDKYAEAETFPLLVLMSAAEITPDMVRAFRAGTGWLGGLFQFVSKQDFSNKELLSLHLATWCVSLPVRYTIKRFVESIDQSLDSAVEQFRQRVRGLGIEDYANIQWLSLQAEGHPLGDYMLWLYKSLLAYLLHDDERVLREQKRLDSISVDQFTPSQMPPSADLADLYRRAITDPGVEEAGPHRRSAPGGSDFHLQLGDMFFKEGGTEVLIVLSPACDLAYAPQEARGFPSERFVLFEYGRMQPIEEPPAGASMRTELFAIDGQVCRILWDHRRAVWKEYGQAQEWLAGQGYKRRSRLAVPYALELQKSFANHLTRIGMPVKPPLFGTADIQVCCKGEDEGWEVIETVPGGVQLVRRKRLDGEDDEELFVLTVDCIGRIIASLQRVAARLTAKQAELTSQLDSLTAADPDTVRIRKTMTGKLTGLGGALEKVQQLTRTDKHWLEMAQKPHPLPRTGGKEEIDARLLWVYRDCTFEGNYNAGPPFVLHIRKSG